MNITNLLPPAPGARNTATEEPSITPEATLSGKPLTIVEGGSTSGLKRSAETEAFPVDQPVKRWCRYDSRDWVVEAFNANGDRNMTYPEIGKWIKKNKADAVKHVKDIDKWVSVVLSRHDDFVKSSDAHWRIVKKEQRITTQAKQIHNILNKAPDKTMTTNQICEGLKAIGVKDTTNLVDKVNRALRKSTKFVKVPADKAIMDTSRGKNKNTSWKLIEPEKNQASTSTTTTAPTTSHQSASGWKTPRGVMVYAPVYDTNSNLTIRINNTNYYAKKADNIPNSFDQNPEKNCLTSKIMNGYKVSDFVKLYNFANESEDRQGIYLNGEFYYLIEAYDFNDNYQGFGYKKLPGKVTSADKP